MPGGLASTVQTWIVETANTGYAAQTRGDVVWGRNKDDGVKLRVRISGIRNGTRDSGVEGDAECYSGDAVFAIGEVETGTWSTHNPLKALGSMGDDGGSIRMMLAGRGGARGASGVKIRVGSLLGVRTPMWDVDIGGEKWVVGVDWVVL